jgi:hypothetical protein
MLIAGIIFWAIGSFVLGIQLVGYIGILLVGAGIIVLVTNRT